jgi:hypothetical protein
VLFGGRPLPERPLWLRLLIVVVVIWAFTPLIRFAYERRSIFGINSPAKMTAEATAVALPKRLQWTSVQNVRCEDHRQTTDWSPGRSGAWDYVCTFVPQLVQNPRTLKVGVRVEHQSIKDVSSSYELQERYIK